MFDIHTVATYVSMIGTCFGLFSRVPQVYKTYKYMYPKMLTDNGNESHSPETCQEIWLETESTEMDCKCYVVHFVMMRKRT